MKNLKLTSFAILTAAGLAACTPTHNVRGNLIEDYQLEDIQAGVDGRSDILRKLGSPTTRAPFDDDVWYYLGQETEKRGVFDPEVKNERVVVVFFNDDGMVEKIEYVDTNRKNNPVARDKTHTSGNEMTVMQQLLGNIGRFKPPE
ncbi:MAG: outer membrane protein assembly factor BamE [Pseudomonadota bacterium]|nr:outer membrane protein assembly factor BamE [Pseudomonadota bacterium]